MKVSLQDKKEYVQQQTAIGRSLATVPCSDCRGGRLKGGGGGVNSTTVSPMFIQVLVYHLQLLCVFMFVVFIIVIANIDTLFNSCAGVRFMKA